MSLFSSFIGGGSTLGIDIGTTSIKVVSLSRTKEGVRMENYGILETLGYLERANSALQTSTLKLSEMEVSGYLSLLLKRMGTKENRAVMSIPSFSAFTTLIEIPASSEREIKNIMEFQAKQYVPLPITEVTLDWQKVGERTKDGGVKMQVLLVAIVNEQLARYRAICKQAGLVLKGVEVEGMSLARALGSGTETPTLLIDIGSRSTGLYVVERGLLKYAGQSDFSGGSLTQSLATGLNISMLRAEQIKKQRGLTGSGGERELSTLMEVMLDVILKEALRIKEKYESTYKEAVGSAVLAGGGASLLGIEEYFGARMGMPVAKANPFVAVGCPSEVAPLKSDLGSHLGVAIGLAQKG